MLLLGHTCDIPMMWQLFCLVTSALEAAMMKYIHPCAFRLRAELIYLENEYIIPGVLESLHILQEYGKNVPFVLQ